MYKTYKQWMGVKRVINNRASKPVLYLEGQIWWCSVGQNVGVESDGKGSNFLRPVLIISQVRSWDSARLVRRIDKIDGRTLKDIKFRLALYLSLI